MSFNSTDPAPERLACTYLVRETSYVVVREPFSLVIGVRHPGFAVESRNDAFLPSEIADFAIRNESFLADATESGGRVSEIVVLWFLKPATVKLSCSR